MVERIMCDVYPNDKKHLLAAEIGKLIDNPAHRKSVAIIDKAFKPMPADGSGGSASTKSASRPRRRGVRRS